MIESTVFLITDSGGPTTHFVLLPHEISFLVFQSFNSFLCPSWVFVQPYPSTNSRPLSTNFLRIKIYIFIHNYIHTSLVHPFYLPSFSFFFSNGIKFSNCVFPTTGIWVKRAYLLKIWLLRPCKVSTIYYSTRVFSSLLLHICILSLSFFHQNISPQAGTET